MLLPLALILSLPAEPKRAPWEAAKGIAASSFWSRDLLVGILWRRAGPATATATATAETEAEVTPSSVVLAATCRVRERVVGVVYLLEPARARGSLGRVSRHAVWVMF